MRPLILLLVFLLAGCLGGGDAEVPDDVDEAQVPVVAVPEWEVGMYWTFDTSTGTTNTLVVTAKDGSGYTTDTDSEDTAFFHAREEISTIGRIRASDLAGEQDGQKVAFFDFPLEDGKSWQATLDGNAYDVTAQAQDDGTWRMSMRQGDVERVAYAYDPEVAWFAWIQYNDETGTEVYRMDIATHGEDFRGEVVRMTLETVVDHALGSGAASEQFPVPEATDLYLRLNATCGIGVQQFAIGPASSAPSLVTQTAAPGHAVQHQCPAETAFDGVVAEGPQEDWAWTHTATDPEARLEFVLLGRTIERFPVAA